LINYWDSYIQIGIDWDPRDSAVPIKHQHQSSALLPVQDLVLLQRCVQRRASATREPNTAPFGLLSHFTSQFKPRRYGKGQGEDQAVSSSSFFFFFFFAPQPWSLDFEIQLQSPCLCSLSLQPALS
jgi:hypothetical protein